MKTLVVRFRSAIKAWKTGRSLNRCPTDPIGKCRAIEIDALAAHDLSLPIGQKMIVALRRQPGLDQSRRGRRLSNAVGTGAAGIFGTAGDDDAELRRNHIQPLRHVLTDAMQVSATDADQASGSMISSIRRRWLGREPRLAVGVWSVVRSKAPAIICNCRATPRGGHDQETDGTLI